METLLQIVEFTEKNRLEHKELDDHGVYHLPLAKDGGFARSGMPFFGKDLVHEYLLARGEEQPAFPPEEDLPRDEHVSFDVYYLVSQHSKTVHRITITRAHNHEAAFIKACFVDGDLIYMSGAGRGKLKVYLFNNEERRSGAIQGNLPRFWFHLEHRRIDVIADAYFSFEKKIWKEIAAKSPAHYGVFVNNESTLNRNSTMTQHQQVYAHYWLTAISFFFLFPVWVAWMFFDGIFILPVRSSLVRCEVRKYLVQEKDGWMAQTELVMKSEANEKTPLLSK